MLNWKSKGGEIEGKEKLVGLDLKLSLALREKDYFPGDTVYGAAFIYISRPENFVAPRGPTKKGKFGPTEVASISILCTGKQYIQLGVRERSIAFYHQQVVLFPPKTNLPMPVDPSSPVDDIKGTNFTFSASPKAATALNEATAGMRESMERKKMRQACIELQKNGSYIYPFRFSLPEILPWTDVVYTPESTDIRGTCRYFVTLILELKNGKRYKSLRSFFTVRPLPVPLARWESQCDPDTLEMPEVEEVDSDEDPEEAEAQRNARIPLSDTIHYANRGRRRSSTGRRRRRSSGKSQENAVTGDTVPNEGASSSASPQHATSASLEVPASKDALSNTKAVIQEFPEKGNNSATYTFPSDKSVNPSSTSPSGSTKAAEDLEITSLTDLSPSSAARNASVLRSQKGAHRAGSGTEKSDSKDRESPDVSQEKRRRRRRTRQQSLSGVLTDNEDKSSKKSDDDAPIHFARLSQAFVSRSNRGSLFYSGETNQVDSSGTEQMRVMPHHRRPSGMRHRPIENDDGTKDIVQLDVLSGRKQNERSGEGSSRGISIRPSWNRFNADTLMGTSSADEVQQLNKGGNTMKDVPQGERTTQISKTNWLNQLDREGAKAGNEERPKRGNVSIEESDPQENAAKNVTTSNDVPEVDPTTGRRHSLRHRSKHLTEQPPPPQELQVPAADPSPAPTLIPSPGLSPTWSASGHEMDDNAQSTISFDLNRAQHRYCRQDGTGSPPLSRPSTPMRMDEKSGVAQASLNALDEDTESGLEMVYSVSIRSSIIKKATANVPIRLNSVVLVPGQELLVELILDAKKGPQLSHLSKIKANLNINGSFKCPTKEKYVITLSSDNTGSLNWNAKMDAPLRLGLRLLVPMHAPLCILSENWKVRAAVELHFVTAAIFKDYVTTISLPVVIVCGVIGRSFDTQSRRLRLWTNNFMHMGIHAKNVKKAGPQGDPFVGIQPVLYQGQRRMREGDPYLLNTFLEAAIAPQPLKVNPNKGGTIINPMLGIGAASGRAGSSSSESATAPQMELDPHLSTFYLWAGNNSGKGLKVYDDSEEDISDDDEEEDILKYDILIRVTGDDDPSILTFLPEAPTANLASDYKLGMPIPEAQVNPLFGSATSSS